MGAKRVVLVLGMHRSGTSAVAKALEVFGVNLGHNLLPAKEGDNDKGYWEDADVNQLNVELLGALGHDWHTLAPVTAQELESPVVNAFKMRAVELVREKLEGVDCLGLKDPRMCRLLPFWSAVFSHVGVSVSYVIAFRHPMSVARSLARRDVGFSVAKSYQLWLEYTLSSLVYTDSQSRVVVDYDRLLDGPAEQLRRLSLALGLVFDEGSQAFVGYCEAFLDDNLRHTKFSSCDLVLDRAVSPVVKELYDLLLALGADRLELNNDQVRKVIGRARNYLSEVTPVLEYVKHCEFRINSSAAHIVQLEAAMKEMADALAGRDERLVRQGEAAKEREDEIVRCNRLIEDKTREVADLHEKAAALQALRSSNSWRLTAPLRHFAGGLRKLHNALVVIFDLARRQPIPVTARKAFEIFRREGMAGIKARIRHHKALFRYVNSDGRSVTGGGVLAHHFGPVEGAIVRSCQGRYSLAAHGAGYLYLEPQRPENLEQEVSRLVTKPQFSIVVPVYNTPPNLLRAVISSVDAQWYPHWELILVNDASSSEETRGALARIDDPRVRVLHRETNQGISAATNAGLEAAAGDFIVFMDHDDELTVDCLYELALCINRDGPDFIYSDEDKLSEEGEYVQPHYKPEWSPDTMMSTMFTGHVSCVRKSLLQKVGGLRSQFDGCQDWDFVLRVAEHTDRFCHIPKVLYHWRIIPASVAADISAKPYVAKASKGVRLDALKRRGLTGSVEPVSQVPGYFRVRYHLQGTPLISIIIPTRDNGRILQRCIESLIKITAYAHYEIIIIDNGSVESSSVAYLKEVSEKRQATVIRHDHPFNYSELNNLGARLSKGEILLFLNDDTEITMPEWLERMGGYAQLPHIGAVGAKMVYPGTSEIQHAGLLNLAHGPVHAFRRHESELPGYFMRNMLEYNWLAVTGACLMIEAKKFEAVGCFDESLPIAYNDVELCFRIVDHGYHNVVCQAVTLVHHESVSRGLDHDDPVKLARMHRELARLYQMHPRYYQYDPYHNPNLHPNGLNFEVQA